jgi:CRISPR-associated protein Cas2
MDNAERYLVCYDISDDHRRDRVHRLLSGFGVRIQFSMFECVLHRLELSDMLRSLAKVTIESQDNVLVFECAKLGTPVHKNMKKTSDARKDFWLA